MPTHLLESRAGKALLWTLAFLLMAGAAAYQRLTGPTHPLRGRYAAGDETVTYRLPRSGSTSQDREVTLAAPDAVSAATVYFKRYKTGDPFSARAMTRKDGQFTAYLPRQSAAGKLEYYLVLETPSGSVRVPDDPDRNVVIRFKDDVPIGVLVPHVVLMFLAILVGIRAGLSALAGHRDLRVLSWVALAGMTAGGLVLGPVVQKYAFGAYWTGFPYGYDLTDNKMLILWLCWVVACAWQGKAADPRSRSNRIVVALASAVMIAVYLIPHSMRGSELDYAKLEQGVPASKAIRTGK